MQKQTLSVRETSVTLGLSLGTVRRLIADGKLPTINRNLGLRKQLVLRDAVERILGISL
jgi:excisionase family DNA binding protein